ncbi:heme peroxidase [Gongronella butleri]|nr:heme peroxidase [Gongronella butleri]
MSWTVIVTFMLAAVMAHGQLSSDFYASTCPLAALTIRTQVKQAIVKDSNIASKIWNMVFSDCFVGGCDASILLNGTNTEKTTGQNQFLSGYEVIDNIKTAVESICPGVVSCADILELAARDAVVALGGPSWNVRLGRRDSIEAHGGDMLSSLPSFNANYNDAMPTFARAGFSPHEMVALLGAHTIGTVTCAQAGSLNSPSLLDPAYAAKLKTKCTNDRNLVPIDYASPNFFDNGYYRQLIEGKSPFLLDIDLMSSSSSPFVAEQQIDLMQFNLQAKMINRRTLPQLINFLHTKRPDNPILFTDENALKI